MSPIFQPSFTESNTHPIQPRTSNNQLRRLLANTTSSSIEQMIVYDSPLPKPKNGCPDLLRIPSGSQSDPLSHDRGYPFNCMLLGSLATTDLTCRHNHFDFTSVCLTTPHKLQKASIADHTSFRVPRPRFQLIATCAVLLRVSLQLQMFAAVWPGGMRVAFE